MSKKLRVMHMLCSNKYSGAENVVCQIIGLTGSANFEFLYASPDGPIKNALADRKITFIPMTEASIKEFKRVITQEKPDIIHAHDMRASFLAALVCGKIPLISHIHNNNFDSQKLTLKAILYRYAAMKAKHIFWVSQSAFDGYYLHKGLEKKSTTLYNVIDPIQLKEKADKAELKAVYDIVYIGRMTYQKNPQRLIEVLNQIIKARPETRCAMIGSGELEDEVKENLCANGLCQNIDFWGFQANPYGILKRAKMMIMTSRWEGTPMCALEAMTLGIPIVSTPTDGLKDLIKNGETGFLSDSDDGLKVGCIKILDNGELRTSMSRKSLERATELMNIDNYRRAILEQYEDKRK